LLREDFAAYYFLMRWPRSSGILLHITSLPSRCGIGDLGPEAYRFVEFLAETGQRIWAILPLGPAGYGDSPYQGFSAFAGNPLLISLERLVEEGFLSPADLEGADFPEGVVDYERVAPFKLARVRTSFELFRARASRREREEFDAFCQENAWWLEDYALFMAVRAAHGGAAWTQWDPRIAHREPDALLWWRRELAEEIAMHMYGQFQFFRQWEALRAYCRQRGIWIMGDLPIYVAHDSADVWVHRDLFHLDAEGRPTVVAGVPPDYFSETGQLWGNPLYRWEVMARTGYAWWIERVRWMRRLVDIIRLDHFRGFEAYWEVPATESTAVRGRWVKGPGEAFFEALERALGELPIVAENLGVITPEVEALRKRFGFPGMAVLQFAFGGDPRTSPFLPHNHERDLVVYTGTHDNNTIVGWWNGEESTLTPEQARRERELARKYLDLDDRPVHWAFIRAALGSVADLAIIPLQDVLGLGSEARMNRPGHPMGNWRWRFRREELTPDLRAQLREVTWLYGRFPSCSPQGIGLPC
jgi:4-alpha-glucanotransferase